MRVYIRPSIGSRLSFVIKSSPDKATCYKISLFYWIPCIFCSLSPTRMIYVIRFFISSRMIVKILWSVSGCRCSLTSYQRLLRPFLFILIICIWSIVTSMNIQNFGEFVIISVHCGRHWSCLIIIFNNLFKYLCGLRIKIFAKYFITNRPHYYRWMISISFNHCFYIFDYVRIRSLIVMILIPNKETHFIARIQ